MWVVTRSINEYDQDGDYFVAAFLTKPNFATLKELLPHVRSDVTIGKLTRGGGREKDDYEWFYLTEMREGVNYEDI